MGGGGGEGRGRLFEGGGAYIDFQPIGGAVIRRGRLFEGGEEEDLRYSNLMLAIFTPAEYGIKLTEKRTKQILCHPET